MTRGWAVVFASLVLVAWLATVPTANAVGTLAIDGTNSVRVASTTSVSLTLTTTKSPDVIFLIIVQGGTGKSVTKVSDTSSLTWNSRASSTANAPSTFTYWAVASSTLSSDSITVTMASSANLDVFAFGISGADTSSPIDPNAALPAEAHGTSTTPSVGGISTTATDDMIIVALGTASNPTVTAGSPFALVSGSYSTKPDSVGEYEVVSSPQSGATAGFTLSASDKWNVIADAVVASGSPIPDLPSGFLLLVVPVALVYFIVSRLAPRARRPRSRGAEPG